MEHLRIFISGPPASGKTTMIKTLYRDYKEYLVGFWTEEVREDYRRVGFKIITTWGTQSLLSSIKIPSKYKIGKYYVYPYNLDKIILELKDIFKENKDKILIIDEIGPMEFYSKEFKEFVKRVLTDTNINLIATIHRNFTHLVNSYMWVTRDKWWTIYKNIKSKIDLWLNTRL